MQHLREIYLVFELSSVFGQSIEILLFKSASHGL